MLRLYGFPVSTFTRTAAMACIEKGVDWELLPIAYGSEEHGALHPFRRMPILEDGETIVFETLAVTGYIDGLRPEPALQPVRTPERTRMLQWMSLCSDYVFRDVVRTLPRGRPAADEELATARRALEQVDAFVTTPFLAGDALSLADLYLAPQISNAAEKAPEALAGLGAIEAWFAGMSQRASFLETAYDPDAL